MNMSPVTFYSRDGSKLAGSLVLPEHGSPESPVPAVVLCQGISGIRNLVLPEIAQHFAEAGFASLAFDYRGCGESEGAKEWILPLQRAEDALYAFAYLAQRPEVDAARVGIYGLSYGGGVAICAAAKEPRTRALVCLSGIGNGEMFMRSLRTSAEWVAFKARLRADRAQRAATGKSALVDFSEIVPFSRTFLKKYNSLKEGQQSSAMAKPAPGPKPQFYLATAEAMIDFHPEDAVRHIARPVLFVNGELDDVATVEQAQEMYNHAPGPKKFVIVPDHDHVDLDAGPGLALQIQLSIQWFQEHLTKEL